jgi:hypothetical protein
VNGASPVAGIAKTRTLPGNAANVNGACNRGAAAGAVLEMVMVVCAGRATLGSTNVASSTAAAVAVFRLLGVMGRGVYSCPASLARTIRYDRLILVAMVAMFEGGSICEDFAIV